MTHRLHVARVVDVRNRFQVSTNTRLRRRRARCSLTLAVPSGISRQPTELPVVQIVPEAAATSSRSTPGQTRDRAVHVGLPEHLVLVRVLGGLARRVERVEAGPAGEPQRLVARDRRDPGLGRSGV